MRGEPGIPGYYCGQLSRLPGYEALGPREEGEGMDWEALVNEGIEARALGDKSNWRLGDLAAEVVTEYGKGDLEKYAGRIRVEYKSLQSYRTIAARFEKSIRIDNLSWAHHQVVAAQPNAEEWLALALRNDWSVEQLREALGRATLKPPPPLPEGKFRVLYADPPWQYDNAGFATSAAAHYPTLATADICGYQDEGGRLIGELGGDDSVLFLWVTNPMLHDGLKVCGAWGYEYKTNLVWVKEQTMAGFYALAQHELLFVAARGSCLPAEGMLPPSVIKAARRAHSEKPDELYGMIEAMYGGPYIELFARKQRDGWAAWGNEVQNETRIRNQA